MIKTLYKFLDRDGAEAMLGNRTLKYCQISELNDPVECIPKGLDLDTESLRRYLLKLKNIITRGTQISADFMFSQEEIESLLIENIVHPELLKQLRELLSNKEKRINNVINEYCVLCLSEDVQNILMWSHYADKQKGIAIGLNREYFTVDMSISAVKYSRYRLSIKSLFNSSIFEFLTAAKKVMLTKAVEWSYEKEWRRYQKITNLERIENPNRRLYVERFPVDCITEIIFGTKFPENEIDSFISCHNFPNVSYYRMKYKEKIYALKKERILVC